MAKEYLKLALRFRAGYFRHILAVTFTNKATQEMKDRILLYLNDFIDGKNDGLAKELKDELKLDDQTFKQNCYGLRSEILHSYSRFSISTIDAFFQKVIRSFTREAGLSGDYRLEVDQDEVLEEVVNNLMDELGKDENLTTWMVEFATNNLESDKPWDVRRGLLEFSKEIFREEFKEIEDDFNQKTSEKNYFRNLLQELTKEKKSFVNYITSRAREAVTILTENNINFDDFKYGNGGAFGWLTKIADFNTVKSFDEDGIGKRPLKEYQSSANWPSKTTVNQKQIIKLAEEKLIPLMNEILQFRNQKFIESLSAEVVLDNFYSFGLIADIARKLKEYKAENNLMLLADAPKFLNKVIDDNETPFIYEKVGSFYKNYLIDEFQDTSTMQWKNFYPLVAESLDSGNESLVVGDVKQAIYRWRGGNLTLLQENIQKQIGEGRINVKDLSSNYRSADELVAFNNALFKTAAAKIAVETGNVLAQNAYHDVEQKNEKPDSGIVRIKFVDNQEETTWKDAANAEVVKTFENLQEAGVSLNDIAILVRKNDDGQQIATHLLNHKNSEHAKPGFSYDVISNESLRIDGASSVNVLLSAMRYLHNPDDVIARAELAYEYAKLRHTEMPLAEVFTVSSQSIFESFLPDEFSKNKLSIKKLPLIELAETLIQMFDLTHQVGELAYLQAFQDLVLNFYARERNDLQAFLEWWEENRNTEKTSLKTSGNVDAAQIITIHKAKGLQFKYVIIPFCVWDLDHMKFMAPNLWVTSDKGIFKNAGYLPVKYSSGLKNTFFNDYYEQEKEQCYVDNLNLLYVAFTRAERGLFVTAPSPGIRHMKNTIASLVYDSIQSDKYLSTKWNNTLQELNIGELTIEKESKINTNGVVSLTSFPSTSWRDKLVIRHAGKSYFNGLDEQFEKVRYGIHVHTVLSYITYIDKIKNAFDQAIADGLLSTKEREEVKNQVMELLSNPLIASWFTNDWHVRTEVPILLPGGQENRIDRLLTNDRSAIVIDYKTGVPSKADQKQVLDYIEILHKMNFTSVDGYVLYVRSGEVVEVKSGKVRIAKKKDENQMDLGL